MMGSFFAGVGFGRMDGIVNISFMCEGNGPKVGVMEYGS